MSIFTNDMIARAIQKRDKNRVALRRSACGPVMIDGLPFSVSVESDGASNSKGVVFTLSGDAVNEGRLEVAMIEATFPTTNSVKTIKRKLELHRTNEGKNVYRCAFTEIKIPECADPNSLAMSAVTEDELRNSTKKQMIFRFTPVYKDKKEAEIMINIYPAINPLDGSATEWVTVTSDTEFFEHGGLKKLMNNKRRP